MAFGEYSNANLKVKGKFNLLVELMADEINVSIKVVRFSGADKTKMISRNEYGYKCMITAMQDANGYIISLSETRVDVDSSLVRREVKLFDTHAFEETWTNACICIHNKWVRNVSTVIYNFDDRIKIISSGGLLFGYSKEDFSRLFYHKPQACFWNRKEKCIFHLLQ